MQSATLLISVIQRIFCGRFPACFITMLRLSFIHCSRKKRREPKKLSGLPGWGRRRLNKGLGIWSDHLKRSFSSPIEGLDARENKQFCCDGLKKMRTSAGQMYIRLITLFCVSKVGCFRLIPVLSGEGFPLGMEAAVHHPDQVMLTESPLCQCHGTQARRLHNQHKRELSLVN